MERQDLMRALEALHELNQFVVFNFCDKIKQVEINMNYYISNMENSGIPTQQCDTFRNEFFEYDKSFFGQLSYNVINNDLPTIKKNGDELIEMINTITKYEMKPFELTYPAQYLRPIRVPNVNNNENAQNYLLQCEAVADFMNFICEEIDKLEMLKHDYERFCNNLETYSVPRQVADEFRRDCFSVDQGNVLGIVDHLMQDHYHIRLHYNRLASILDRQGITGYPTQRRSETRYEIN